MRIFLTILVFFIFNTVCAQLFTDTKYKVISTDAFIGLPIFYGDIPNQFGFTFSGKLNWHLTSALALNTELSLGQLNGIDTKTKDFFSNNYIKVMVGGEAYLFNILQFNKFNKFFQPYGGISIGYIKSNISKSGKGDHLNTELYDKWNFIYQYVGGLKFKLSNSFDLNFKTIINLTKTDKLDNYKPAVIANKYNDAYSEYVLGITFHFGENDKEPILWKVGNNIGFKNIPENKENEEEVDLDPIGDKIREIKTSTIINKVIDEEPIENDSESLEEHKEKTNEKETDVDNDGLNCTKKY